MAGLDVSQKHIGVAISSQKTALPIDTIKRIKFLTDIAALKKVIAEHNIDGLVIGLPIEMSGNEGARAQSVRDFTSLLTKTIPLPIAFWDERLTTKQAAKQADTKKSRNQLDSLAAAIILQAALDRG